MHPHMSLPITLLHLATALASPTGDLPHNPGAQLLSDLTALAHRALPNNPSGGYAPAIIPCPAARPTLRRAGSLSQNETSWLADRRPLTVDPMVELLTRANITDFDAATYIRNAAANNLSALPNIAIAVSGGGYRALMNGAGFLKAADNRVDGTTAAGGIGGLLQATTYLAGLSGGGWLVGSLFANNFSTVENLQRGSDGSSVWKFDSSIFAGPKDSGISIVNTAEYWVDVADQVASKANAGFDTSITDYWGRALSYQLVNATDGGPAYTFSSIADTSNFQQAGTPFPILVADGRAPDETIISLNATNFEFNPFEMGSWDPTVYGFAPTKYLASNFSGGVVPSTGSCVEGFDQIGYVMGTSSSLFNQFLLTNLTELNVPSLVIKAITDVLEALGNNNNDIAQYMPNPFLGWSNATNPGASSIELSLVDGGEDLQNIPLNPLLQPARAVDVIFAVDSSADTTVFWPNGTALRATYDRQFVSIANGTAFPAVPDAATFINKGLNSRPAFFGCDAGNFSAGVAVPPLVVYVPNAPYTAFSNVSTFDPSYSLEQRDQIIENAYNGATQGNGSLDAQWPTCVGCAVLSRSLWRTNTTVPQVCQDCFTRYCWDGSLNSTDNGPYFPDLKIGNGTVGAKSAAVAVKPGRWGMVGTAVATVVLGVYLSAV
ncbi:lysophospholipase [Coniochaeta ligniaria NRRL 30616]|uniref:Lysophospholipase n=1 Tax=Coniochaeta ligniaria NRRL 30616 TaxID=1408157 RepID=A0A1J7IEX4_9PEZI|nr:lysophospholipase [Coniochaeta ligniaria NRRL 30616]